MMLTREARSAGVAAALVVTPYYNRPSPAGLSAHFRAVAGATDLPVVLYDIPVRSGRRIGPELTVQLAREVPNIVAVKDATGDVASAAEVIAESRRLRGLLRRRFAHPAVRRRRRCRGDQRGLTLGRPGVRRDGPQLPRR